MSLQALRGRGGGSRTRRDRTRAGCPLSRGGGGESGRRADQFRNVQVRSRGGGDEDWTTRRRASAAERSGVEGAVSEVEAVVAPARASRVSGSVSPGGRAAGEQQVRAREGWGVGQEGRLSDGQAGQAGGGAGGQQPVGIAATGAVQTAATGDAKTSGNSPASSPRARNVRARRVCLIGVEARL